MSSLGESTSQWSLFGMDLERYARRVALAVRQLVWEPESGFQKRFSPPALLLGDTQRIDAKDAKNFGLWVG